ncbi:VirB4 family type IV secretion system protein (plasmid) [Alkalihalophilus sp. As8PL]|uniref:VirB4 family type IV secretion system protein n=1 Tax=Alkalihalophilus sp. As8PL TaxID=3237103 RepID=A0AB39BNJ9_9BACI
MDEENDHEIPSYQLDTMGDIMDIISPDGISIKDEDHGVIKQSAGTKTYYRPAYIPPDGYPRKMQTNWLYDITASGEVDVLVDVHKVTKSNAIQSLQKQQTMLQSNLSFQRARGNIDQISDLNTKINDTLILSDEIQFNENDMFNISTFIMMYGSSKKELDAYSEYLEDLMSGSFFRLTTAWSRIKKGFISTLPIGTNKLQDTIRNIDRRALSTFSPYISGAGKYMGGIPFGINRITGQKEFLNSFGNDRHRPDNYNMGIFGISGSGKSLAMKLKIARENAAANVYAGIIDPEGEFSRLTTRLGGINLNISEESEIRINPCAINYSDIPLDDKDDEELESLELEDDKKIIEKNGVKYLRFVPIREKVNELLDFFDIIVRGKEDTGLNVFERNFLEDAVFDVFAQRGITTDPDSLFEEDIKEIDGQLIQSQVRKPEPELFDIFKYLKGKFGDDPKADRLLAALKPFLRTGSKPLFDGQTFLGRGVTQSLENSRLVNFNISQLEEGFLRPIAFHVILNYLWEYFAKNLNNAHKKKYIYCDELWQFVDGEQTIKFFEKVARRARKRNCGLVYASQDFVRLLENKKARGIVTNTYTILFMKQNKIDLAKIRENFPLTEGELGILFNQGADKGEAILRIGLSTVWLKTDPSDEEMVFIESNQAVLDEMMKRKRLAERV